MIFLTRIAVVFIFYSSFSFSSLRILGRLPSKLAPPTARQAWARFLMCRADRTTSSLSRLSAKASTVLFRSVRVRGGARGPA